MYKKRQTTFEPVIACICRSHHYNDHVIWEILTYKGETLQYQFICLDFKNWSFAEHVITCRIKWEVQNHIQAMMEHASDNKLLLHKYGSCGWRSWFHLIRNSYTASLNCSQNNKWLPLHSDSSFVPSFSVERECAHFLQSVAP